MQQHIKHEGKVLQKAADGRRVRDAHRNDELRLSGILDGEGAGGHDLKR